MLDRFPNLRVGFFESGLGWIPYWLDRLDEHGAWRRKLPRETWPQAGEITLQALTVKPTGDLIASNPVVLSVR